jgi:hypothetical protein
LQRKKFPSQSTFGSSPAAEAAPLNERHAKLSKQKRGERQPGLVQENEGG